MEGNYQEAQLFILKQCHEAWINTQRSMEACNTEIESTLNESIPEEGKDKQRPKIEGQLKRNGKNSLGFDVHQMAYQYYGVDLSGIDGVSSGLLSVLMSEIGTREDFLKSFKSAKHFCSWLGLCPDQRISGGKVLSSKTRRVVNRVTEAFRMSAFGVTNAHNGMGEYARRMKSRLGKVEGTTAVAHKIARLVYTLINTRIAYDQKQAFKPNAYSRVRKLNLLKKIAKSLDVSIEIDPVKSSESELVI